MGGRFSNCERSLPESTSRGSNSIPLDVKPSIRIQPKKPRDLQSPCLGLGENFPPGDVILGGNVVSLSPPPNIFISDSDDEEGTEGYMTIMEDETGLSLQEVAFHSCQSLNSLDRRRNSADSSM